MAKRDARVDRRNLLKSWGLMGLMPLAGLSLSGFQSDLGLAQPGSMDLEWIELTTRAKRQVKAALALPKAGPEGGETWPAVLLIHEWWGLNEEILSFARTLADQGFIVLAADLFGGAVVEDAAAARYQERNIKRSEALDTLKACAAYLRSHKQSNGKLGTCGWGFGGTWSLEASLAVAVDATVVYYGDVGHSVDDLRSLKGPVLGHFGTRDLHINHEMVESFEINMTKAGRLATLHWYEADHTFANPATTRYHEEAATLAFLRTLEFFKTYLS